MSNLANKVVVITGGNSGIGLATVKRFIDEGAEVVITGRNQEKLDAAVSDLGGRVTAIQNDVNNIEELEDLFEKIKIQHGRIDVLFANSGIAPLGPFENVTAEDFDALFNTNVKGLFFTIQKSLPLLSKGASVILNASIVAQSGLPNTSIYSASKAAVRSLGRTLAAELAPRDIRVNVVSPGLVHTPFWEKVGLSDAQVEAFGAQVVQMTPLGRAGKPEEIAATVAFLASDDSSYITGSDLAVDGGLAQV